MRKKSSSLFGALLVALLSLAATTAFADDGKNEQEPTDLNRLTPAVRPSDGFAITRPNDLGHLGFAVNAILNYGYLPQSVILSDGKKWKLVEHQLMGNLGLSIGFFERISIDALIPLQLYMSGQSFKEVEGKPKNMTDGGFKEVRDNKIGFGDARIGLRGRIYGENDDFFSIGLYLGAVLPTSQWINPMIHGKGQPPQSVYWGSSDTKIDANVLMEFRPLDRLNLDINVGGLFTLNGKGEEIFSFGLDQQLNMGLGGSYAFLENKELTVHAEVFGKLLGFKYLMPEKKGEDNPFAKTLLSAEWLAGVKYRPGFGITAGLAVGGGMAYGWGTPLVRGLFTLGWDNASDPDTDGDGIKDSVDQCPEEPEDMDGFEDLDGCPDPDNDGDGILDTDDQCPMDPEDIDGFEDSDGCPDPDNDGDGVLDIDDQCPEEVGLPERQGCPIRDADGDGIEDDVDKCPSEPEDKDGFQDEDGCPDLDNDEDGIPDASDKCPNEAGPASNNGCPIQDRDKDGIPDDLDKCPDEPETYNGIKDEDGCPDGKATVIVTEREIQIKQTIYFATGKSQIKKQSFQLLDTVANVVNKYDLITKLLVAGHTDDVGQDDKNMQLSKERAQAVRDYLVSKGVDPNRLESEGYGETQPLCKDMPELTKTKRDARKNRRKIKECRSDNRRVEFRVVEINNKPVAASDEIKVKVEEKVQETVTE